MKAAAVSDALYIFFSFSMGELLILGTQNRLGLALLPAE